MDAFWEHQVGGAVGDNAGGYFPPEGCDAAAGSAKPWSAGKYDYDAFMKNTHAWLPTWVEKEDIAWAVHCGLGCAVICRMLLSSFDTKTSRPFHRFNFPLNRFCWFQVGF